MLSDWLWGDFRFFSGDDKTSWFYIASQRWDMTYLPDINVKTIEVIKGWGISRAYQNMRRWSGNMLRNGTRAMSLGPLHLGPYLWLGVFDQRISM